MPLTNKVKTGIAGSALVLAGLGLGVTLASTSVANATDSTTSTESSTTSPESSTTAPQGGTPSTDQSKPQRSDETLLTGTTAEKVRAAALAKYPNATIQRVETDSDGVYEAHIVTADGASVIVQVGKDFAVTGTQTGGPGGGRGHGAPPSSSSSTTTTES